METKPVEVKRTALAPVETGIGWLDLRREIEGAFDRFSRGFGPLTWKPFGDSERLWRRGDGFIQAAMDVSEDEKAYTVSIELPGLDEKNVNVSVKGDMLVIEGEKQQEKEEKSKEHYLSERSYGAIKRSFTLPADVDAAKVKAQFIKGVLTVTLPKNAAAQSVRKIEVKAA